MALTRPKYSQIYDSDFKNSCRVATATNVTLSGAAPTVVDGVTIKLYDRVLVRAQSAPAQNGIYFVTVLGTGINGTWTRALDATDGTRLTSGTSLSVEEGATFGGKLFRMTSPNPINLGVSDITWVDVSGGGAAASGNDGQLQYNDNNAPAGTLYAYYNKTSGQLKANATTASTSTTTGAFVVTGGVGISGALNVGDSVTVTGNVLPSANVTYNLGSASQRWKDLYLSGTTIDLNGATISATNGAITFQNSLGGSFSVTGSSSGQSTGTFGNLVANSGISSSNTTTGALVVTGGVGISGTINVGGDVVVSGGLTVNGTTTNINTTNLVVEDKNIIIGDVATPSDLTAEGGGITLKGATDKTFNWTGATSAWTSSEDLNLLSGKVYEINGTSVLSSTTLGSGVTASSLTSLGTITSLVATSATINGGSVNNTTIGATTHTTGRFTTLTATSVSAGTIGNSGAVLTGTLSTAEQPNITSVGTLTSLAVGAVTSTATIIASTVNAGTIGNAGTVLTGTLSTAAQTNITSLGTLTGLTVSGAIVPNANLTVNLGSTTAWFNTLYGVSTQAKYADLAENYQADAAYEPGTVLVFGGTNEVTTTTQDHNTAVAGIVSTNPAHLMNGMLVGQDVVAVGLTGRLPCRVQGPVNKGDVLVTSTTPGVAQKINNSKFLPGCIVGKALGSINTNNIQTIEVVVGRF